MNQLAPTEQRNGLGTAGFVLGLVGLLIALIPLLGVLAWPLVVLGVIFSAVGIARVRRGAASNKGLAIAGLVVSIVGLGACVLWSFVINTADNTLEEEAAREVEITYEVTGDTATADIEYSTYSDDGVESHAENGAKVPWTKKVTAKGLLKGGSLLATTGESGGKITCRVLVDGKETETGTASGPFAMATCTGF
ncbi:MmpS family transport accessory protein [Actinophytocola xanthii]|uniref:DUF4190 domain-containing protein n=1 Tax=Actinophytocola xanthii TaxID=1912961 RepID=A0A1Q8CUA0_9PSEU|nr:MmpS family transport accessory protein [Actinophytocola xanthii]OLF17930.1 hypothetical protein BU204_08965 [Actinophytocola xanthii]